MLIYIYIYCEWGLYHYSIDMTHIRRNPFHINCTLRHEPYAPRHWLKTREKTMAWEADAAAALSH